MIDRTGLYRFPWSKTDNPGAWIEVTDKCDLECKGCYREQIAGHRDIKDIKEDILASKKLTNCDFITIAGGEPLIYPQILEVVKFIKKQKIKPIIFTNGEKLDLEFCHQLKEAGLSKLHIHITSEQSRPGWMNSTEEDLNRLREYYADMVKEVGGMQCGFHVIAYRSNLSSIPIIVDWAQQNIQKVQHVSFIAYRAVPINKQLGFYINGDLIDPKSIKNSNTDSNEIDITTPEMYKLVHDRFPHLKASCYLNGTSDYNSLKFLIASSIGTRKKVYGVLGPRTVEIAQVFYHLFKGRYFAFLPKPTIGHKVFLLSLFDREVRKAFRVFLKSLLQNPMHLFNRIYLQSIHFQQPNEIVDGQINLCDDCVNMMVYKGKLINSCRLDEYRKYDAPMVVVKSN
jgi:organic radical activating enzyme